MPGGARPKVKWCAVTMPVRSCFSVYPLLWFSVDQMLRNNWIVDAVIYIFGAWGNQYPCRLSFMSLHWFTNMLHQHSVLMRLFLQTNLNYIFPNPCINVKSFFLAATTTSLSLVNEAQYLMINRASVQLIQELMSSRFTHPESCILTEIDRDAFMFTLYFVICGNVA